MLYSELQCSPAIHQAVERMGFAEMTEIQEKTIPVMMAGHDVIAKAPTGNHYDILTSQLLELFDNLRNQCLVSGSQ